jgi:hypothetical protein
VYSGMEWQAREIVTSRRREARQSMLVAAARLGARRNRVQARQERAEARLAGNPIDAS